MASLKGSKTEQNLKDAFAGESQANRRYLYFANKADIEGQNDVAALFRSTAEGETGHAHGHLEYLEAVGDPATGLPIGSSRNNLQAAVAGETHEYTDMYPGMAKTARDEGFDEIADWFETLTTVVKNFAFFFRVWVFSTCNKEAPDSRTSAEKRAESSGEPEVDSASTLFDPSDKPLESGPFMDAKPP
jgi:rubrerythrin